MNTANVFSGARAIFYVDDKKVGYASGCEGSEEIIHEPVDVLDNLEVQEFVPVGYRVSFTAQIFRTVKGVPGVKPPKEGAAYGSLKESGVFPSTVNMEDILLSGTMTVKIIDRVTKKVIMLLEEVRTASQSWSITPRGLVGQNVTFNAIRMKDETEVASAT